MKTSVSLAWFAISTSIAGVAVAQGEAPAAPEGAAPPAAPPAAPAPAPASAPPPPATTPAEQAPSDAGGARTHDGFFFRLGFNFGPLIMNSKVEGGGAAGEADYSGFHGGTDLMFGGSPVKGLAIGGALILGRTTDPKVKVGAIEGTADGDLLFAGVGLFADYYLDPHKGLHFQGMIGFSAADFVASNGTSGGNDPTGTFFGIGAGYDFWIGDEWSIGPFARVLYAPMSAEAGGLTNKVTYLYPSIGLALTLH